jgi:hypothetical protein
MPSAGIGRKGIGFKSVFMISNNPHVFSQGFRFKFDVEKYGLFGYVCPEWVDEIPEHSGVSQVPDVGQGTYIWLPMTADRRSVGSTDTIQIQFDPVTLLFLRKICKVSIEQDGCLRTWQLQQRFCDDGHNDGEHTDTNSIHICDLHCSGGAVVDGSSCAEPVDAPKTYILCRKSVDIPEEMGGGGSEISIAFPEIRDLSKAVELQHVFSFLPVDKYGFAFAIHADLELTSSRQQVISDSARNLWLRDQIASVFAYGMDSSEALRENLGIYLEISRVTDSFWQPVFTQILDGLQSEACLQSESGAWKKPNQLLIRHPKAPLELISNEMLQLTCEDLEFVDSASSNVRVAEQLGCRTFQFSDMAQIINSDMSFEADAVNLLYVFLHEIVDKDNVSALFSMRIFRIRMQEPLENDLGFHKDTVRTCLADGPIFSSIPATWDAHMLRAGCMRVLCEECGECEAIQPFLASVGVVPATVVSVVQALIQQHTQATFLDIEACWTGLHFMHDHLWEYVDLLWEKPEALQEIQNCILVPSADESLMLASQLSVRGVLGVECPCTLQTEGFYSPKKPWEVRSHDSSVNLANKAVQPGPRQLTVAPAPTDGPSALSWEAFFTVMGAAPHHRCCQIPSTWTQFAKAQPACPICFESLPFSMSSALLPCSHRFHTPCIGTWICNSATLGDHASCPICRAPTTYASLETVEPDPLFIAVSFAH